MGACSVSWNHRPNGAGKTTFAEEFLPKEAGCSTFVNADLIAAGIAPFEPERAAFRAGRLMLEEIYSHARRSQSFVFETTLSGRGYAGLIPGWRTQGYIVKLFFLRLASPDLAIARVRQRVREGGPQHPRTGHPAELRFRATQFRKPLQTAGR